MIHFSGWMRASASRATPKRRDLSQRADNSGAVVLTCDEMSLMRERWNAPPRSMGARFSPYHEPITTRPEKRVSAMASFRAEGLPLSSKVRSNPSCV